MRQHELVKQAFSNQSKHFDSYELNHPILTWMRNRIRNILSTHIPQKASILELNSGSGLDAVYFAKNGHSVLATDISPGMIEQIQKKVKSENLTDFIEIKQAPFEQLCLDLNQQFDFVFSNFGGLNCTNKLKDVVNGFKANVKAKGHISLIIMPKYCPWELIYSLRFAFKFAFRRLRKHAIGKIEGIEFTTYYYSKNQVIDAFGPDFKCIELIGLASLSFPPFMEKYARRYPKLYRLLCSLETKVAGHLPFNRFCDHYIITFQYLPE